MAKLTRGKSKKAQKPVTADEIIEEILQDTSDVDAPEGSQETAEDAVAVAEEVDPIDAPEVTEVVETTDISEETSIAAPEPVVEKKSGFVPLVLGGVIAAFLGVVSAQYIFPNGLPFGAAVTAKINFERALKQQSGRIDNLQALLNAQPEAFTGPLEAAVAAVGNLQTQIGAVVENVGALETRVAILEEQPNDNSGISQAMANELVDLRAALDLQKGELAQIIDEAQNTKQNAEDTARQTMARAAVMRILVALESGAPFADALAEVEANTDVTIPEVLAQSATDGLPTVAALGDSYPEAARAALAVVRSEETGGGVTSFLTRQLEVRSVTPREGDDPDAILSRVGAAIDAGRISDALVEANTLPDGAKAPLADWMQQANLRLSAAREAEVLASTLNSQ
ncbi:hypothetical protein [Planktotalea sp.]|uniref:COG4223 family protein n=1 Tax=Planktotalea sp. TaxID=2029877 RepID=UPI0025EA723E|nr:hypothetical protein [Planktotalea sp.]